MKQKKCKFCGKLFILVTSLQKCCSVTCALSQSRLDTEKQLQNKWKTEKKALKEKNKTLSDWKKELQTEINHIIRLIDNGCPCIAIGKTTGKRNAGHYYSVGSNPTLRFHLDNIHIQSEYSNTYKSGDSINYMNGLIRTYGKDYFDYVSGLKSLQPINLTVNDLKEKIKIARQIVKEMSNNYDCQFTSEDRLGLRNEFNNRIGIY